MPNRWNWHLDDWHGYSNSTQRQRLPDRPDVSRRGHDQRDPTLKPPFARTPRVLPYLRWLEPAVVGYSAYGDANAIWEPLTGEPLWKSAARAAGVAWSDRGPFTAFPPSLALRSMPGIVRFLRGVNNAVDFHFVWQPQIGDFKAYWKIIPQQGKE